MMSSENRLMDSPIGVIIRPSPYSVDETMERVVSLLLRRGSTIYTRIDQQAELQTVGQHIPPILFILFGNPSGGGPVIVENPLAALDLPLKLIVWEDHLER